MILSFSITVHLAHARVLVFERYQALQLELERQPIAFLLRARLELMAEARAIIADFLNVADSDIVFVTNATAGLNVALRSLRLEPGDEILTTESRIRRGQSVAGIRQ